MWRQEYREACRGDPMRYANAAERLLAAIGEPQMIDTAKDARLGRIFLQTPLPTHSRQVAFYGMEETIERIGGFFRHAAQGLCRPVRSSGMAATRCCRRKSLAERLKSLMEV